MADQRFIRHDIDSCVGHVIEECGETCAALGKTLRWGWASYDPTIPEAERESNWMWVKRELQDLKGAIARLETAMETEL